MKRDPSIELFYLNCMDGMITTPDKYYDLGIVDPPYYKNKNLNNGLGREVIHKKIKWNPPDEKYFKELNRVCKNIIIWGAPYFTKQFPEMPFGRIVHHKLLTSARAGLKFSECDIACHSFHKRIDFFQYQWSGNVQNGKINWKNTGPDARIHPTQKPIALYKWILKTYAKPGDKILDTHLGSGSIAIACYDMGFDLVGYEIDLDHYNAAVQRLEIHKKQLQINF